jgi:hypothetical protein
VPLTGCTVGNVLLTTSHELSVETVHVQLAAAVTLMIQFASAEPTSNEVLSSVTVQPGAGPGGVAAAAWDMV